MTSFVLYYNWVGKILPSRAPVVNSTHHEGVVDSKVVDEHVFASRANDCSQL